MEAKIGPVALASAPKDLNIPRVVPFCEDDPYFEAIVVIHVTTTDVAVEREIKLIVYLFKWFKCNIHVAQLYLHTANRKIPAIITSCVLALPIRMKAGTIMKRA